MTALDPTCPPDVASVPAPRGRRLGRIALVGAVLVAAALGLSAYQLLAELDPVDLEQRLDALRAAAERAEATLSELKARHAFAA